MSPGPKPRDGARDQPIADCELPELFRGLDAFPAIVLAVSGGPDSSALMALIARWVKTQAAPPRVLIATVDHGLRKEAADEARQVATAAAELGFEHRTVVIDGVTPKTGVQAWARAERYRLLTDCAAAFAGGTPVALVTAHTEDDQAETLLMRLARGSGVDGLAAMAPARTTAAANVMLVRPLLGVSKARLIATLRAAGRTWVEDPSNQAVDFERVRLREAAPVLTSLGLSNDQIARSARRLNRQRAALEAATEAFGAACQIDRHSGLYATLDTSTFQDGPEELRVRVLIRLVAAFGGQAEPARLSQIEHLVEALGDVDFPAMTVGGALVDRHRQHIRVFREPGRDGLDEITIGPGERKIWDRRFAVALATTTGPAPGDPVAECRVRALGSESFARIRGKTGCRKDLPALAGVTLPSFWIGEQLAAVPHLGFADPAIAGVVLFEVQAL